MNGFAALDIPPCRRYVVVKATARFAVCRLILKSLLFYSCLDFTQNLGEILGFLCFLCQADSKTAVMAGGGYGSAAAVQRRNFLRHKQGSACC